MKAATRGAIGVAGFTLATSLLIAFMGNPFSGPFGGPTQPAGGASTEEPTFTSTQTDGGAAFVAPTGTRVCLNGDPCTVYATYDGGTVGVVGAPLEVPDGFADGVLAAGNVDVPGHAFIAQAATGQYGFRALHNSVWDFGNSTTDYCQSVQGEVQCAGAWQWGSIEVETIGSQQGFTTIFSPRIFPGNSLATCTSGTEGRLGAVTGASLSAQTRVCACVSDGAGTPAFTWINLGCPNTAGTASTCPVCP